MGWKDAEKILGKINYDINIETKGGGQEARIEASRLAIAIISPLRINL